MRSDSPGGTTTDLFGQEVVPAHRSRPQENNLVAQSAMHDILCRALDELAISYAGNASTHGLLIPAIYGRKCGDSSPSAALQSSLGNRLQVRMAECGLPEYRLRWKYWVLLLGQRICALRASARRTFDKDCGGWPTPQAMEAVYQSNGYGPNLTEAAKLAGWQTPKSSDGVRSTPRTSDRLFEKTTHLQTQVKLTGWATPRSVENGHGKGNPSRALNHKSRLEDQIYLAGWPTPDAQAMNVGCDPKRHLERLERLKEKYENGHGAGLTLGAAAALAGWPTPMRNNGTGAGPRGEGGNNLQTAARWAPPKSRNHKGKGVTKSKQVKGVPDSLDHQVETNFGTMPCGFRAETEERGALDPVFSLWLMGFPATWPILAPHKHDWQQWQVLMAPVSSEQKAIDLGLCEDRATPSSPRSPQRSLKQHGKLSKKGIEC